MMNWLKKDQAVAKLNARIRNYSAIAKANKKSLARKIVENSKKSLAYINGHPEIEMVRLQNDCKIEATA